ADQRVNRGEAGADLNVARVLFGDGDDEVAAARDVGFLGRGLDFLEVVQTFQAGLADLDVDHVEDLAGIDGQLAPDHAVLGLGVATNFDFLDLRLLALADLVLDVYRAGLRVGVAAGGDFGVDVAFGAEGVLDSVGILV